MEHRTDPSRDRQPNGRGNEVQRGRVALSKIEKRAVLRDILYGPPDDRADDDEIVDPYEGWERVPPTLDALLDDVRRIEKTYERAPWSLRRFEVVGWLNEISESYGPFRCLTDLSSALRSIDCNDAPSVHPMLQPDFRQGRPKLTRTEFRNHCMVALAIDALRVAGWTIEQSAKAISERLSKPNDRRVRIRTIRYSSVPVPTSETIKNWRQEIVRIAQGKGRHSSLIREMAVDYLSQRKRLLAVIAAGGVGTNAIVALLLEQMRPLPRLRKPRLDW
jgi:hypothetical protein